ncbi:hypothetical protein SAMD00023353_4500090 [Rosellinia necatrix]|uniref:Uncharacterized protein n=1 Tax=Rosellinia necatrix TaxID=77044 RepID=A0A1W2TPU9_ROSNE|nr:hypothetical protein SAMD00023353_4500090 [Rosellinia necatrix]
MIEVTERTNSRINTKPPATPPLGAPPTPPPSNDSSPENQLSYQKRYASPKDQHEDTLVLKDIVASSNHIPGTSHVKSLGILIEEDTRVQEDQSVSSAPESKPRFLHSPLDGQLDISTVSGDLASVLSLEDGLTHLEDRDLSISDGNLTEADQGRVVPPVEEPKSFFQRFILKISQVASTLARQRDKARERRVGNLFYLIDEIRRGVYDSDSREVIERKIPLADYELFKAVVNRRHHEHLIEQYEADKLRNYIKNDLKYEYIPSTRGRQQFRILMRESTLHKFVRGYWDREIGIWLRGIETNESHSEKTRDLANAVENFGDDDVQLPGETQCFPDSYWEIRYPATDTSKQKPKTDSFPSLVIEVVWSHKLDRDKINNYILKSDGAIRTVVCIDLYKTWTRWGRIKRDWKVGGNNLGPVHIQVWRAQRDLDGTLRVAEGPETQVCRKDGALDAEQIACLSLRDFVAERDEDRTGMSAEELQGLEGLLHTLDARAVVEKIKVGLEKQREKDNMKNNESKPVAMVQAQGESRMAGHQKVDKKQTAVEIGGRRLRWLSKRREG